LSKLGKGKLHTILSKSNIKPHKIDYYLENRDPDFDRRMTKVLFVYKEVEMQNEIADKSQQSSVTISYDEKPGIQAIKNIAADLLPIPGKYQMDGFVRCCKFRISCFEWEPPRRAKTQVLIKIINLFKTMH